MPFVLFLFVLFFFPCFSFVPCVPEAAVFFLFFWVGGVIEQKREINENEKNILLEAELPAVIITLEVMTAVTCVFGGIVPLKSANLQMPVLYSGEKAHTIY